MSDEDSKPSTQTPGTSAHAERAQPGSWPKVWFEALRGITSVSAGRRAQVLLDTQEGSQPTAIYYTLLGLSELIAGFALMINSDATLIGANVVAPLMTPIFGVSLGLMRSDFKLLRRALMAEFGGATLGVALCFVLGLFPFAIEPSAALLAQTRPTLIDLAVATLAGFAGGLAMIDERVSPALPGVAIATALNPPIAAIGLCLAYGAYEGAWGAFILFFANVLAIMAVAAVLFLVAGFVTKEEFGSVRGLVRRFAVAAVSLVLVTVLLTNYLVRMVTDLRTAHTINQALTASLAHEPGTALVTVDITQQADRLDVLATIRTPRILSTDRVAIIQDKLAAELGRPVRLFLRCGVTKDVIATGSTNLHPYVSLKARGTETQSSLETIVLQEAEQVAREVVAARPQIVLKDVEMIPLDTGAVLVFSVENPRNPSPAGVARFEAELRKRIVRPHVRVVVRTVDSNDMTSKGRILLGEAHFGDFTPEQAAMQAAVEAAVRSALQDVPNTFVTAADAVEGETGWIVRAEAVGPRTLTPEEVAGAERRGAAAVGKTVSVSVRTTIDLMTTSRGYFPVGGDGIENGLEDQPPGQAQR